MIMYLCNGKKCEKCDEGCKFTDDVKYALNFVKDKNGSYHEDDSYLEIVGDAENIIKACKKKSKRRKKKEVE